MTASLVYGLRVGYFKNLSSYNNIIDEHGFVLKGDLLYQYASKISLSDPHGVVLIDNLGLPYGVTDTLKCLLSDMELTEIDPHATNWFLILED